MEQNTKDLQIQADSNNNKNLDWLNYWIVHDPTRARFFSAILLIIKLFLGFLICWVSLSIVVSEESKKWRYLLIYLISVLVVIMVFFLLKKYISKFKIWVLGSLIISLLLIKLSGRQSDFYVYLCLVGTFFAASLIFRKLNDSVIKSIDRDLPFNFPAFFKGIIFIFIFLPLLWISCSILEYVWIDRTSSANLLKPERLKIAREKAKYKTAKIGLTLSGGGYRAAVMHTGVLHALEKLGYPPTHITTISGGSIIGAFYAAGGDPLEFKKLVIDGKFNLKRELTKLDNMIKLICPLQVPQTEIKLLPCNDFSRTNIQISMLDRILLNNTKFSNLNTEFTPRLMIGATDLNTGQLLGISTDGILLIPQPLPLEKNKYVNSPGEGSMMQMAKFLPTANLHLECSSDYLREPCNESLSTFVSASGAYPFAFSAMRKEFKLDRSAEDSKDPNYESARKNIKYKDQNYGLTAFGIRHKQNRMKALLADGGIIDNTGLFLLLHAANREEDWNVNFIFMSDASGIFKESENISSLPNEVLRSIDVVYSSTGVFNYRKLADDSPAKKLPILNLSPANIQDFDDQKNTLNRIFEDYYKAENTDFTLALELLIENISDENKRLKIKQQYLKIKNRSDQEEAIADSLDEFLNLLAIEILESKKNFEQIDTLEDQLNKNQADKLFWLGLYLVFEGLIDIPHGVEQLN